MNIMTYDPQDCTSTGYRVTVRKARGQAGQYYLRAHYRTRWQGSREVTYLSTQTFPTKSEAETEALDLLKQWEDDGPALPPHMYYEEELHWHGWKISRKGPVIQ
jgi:hypothetical protein